MVVEDEETDVCLYCLMCSAERVGCLSEVIGPWDDLMVTNIECRGGVETLSIKEQNLLVHLCWHVGCSSLSVLLQKKLSNISSGVE